MNKIWILQLIRFNFTHINTFRGSNAKSRGPGSESSIQLRTAGSFIKNRGLDLEYDRGSATWIDLSHQNPIRWIGYNNEWVSNRNPLSMDLWSRSRTRMIYFEPFDHRSAVHNPMVARFDLTHSIADQRLGSNKAKGY
jgi:hypothetical protein